MKLIAKKYTHSPLVFSFSNLLFLTFRFLFGNRLRNIPYRAFYNVYTDQAGNDWDGEEQIM